jgi:hypothetical protein
VTLTIWRDGKRSTLQATIADWSVAQQRIRQAQP